MNFHFNFERALQARACLLRLDGKRMGLPPAAQAALHFRPRMARGGGRVDYR